MLATIKFAFRTVFAKPVRFIISFILITVTLCLTAGFVAINTFDISDAEKRIYFTEEDNSHYESAYLNYCYSERFRPLGFKPIEFPRGEVETLCTDLDEYDYGYAITQFGRQPTAFDQKDGYATPYAGSVLGAYRLDSFFGCFDMSMFQYDYDAISEGVNRFFDDEGNIAPFFPRWDAYGVSYAAFYKGTTCLVDGTEVSALDTFGYSVYGRLPEKANEVVIPQSIYNSFAAYGYCNAGDIEQEDNVRGEVEEINSYDDIIGKTIKLGTGKATRSACIDATIVGVLAVDYEEHNWSYYVPYYTEKDCQYGWVEITYTYPLFFDIIVSQEYFNTYADEETYAELVTVSRNVEQGILEDYFNLAICWHDGMTFRELFSYDEYYGVYYHVSYYMGRRTDNNDALYTALLAFLSTLEPFFPLIYVMLPFCFLLAGFLLYSSIENRRRQAGILRSLGASGKQITLSFFLALAVFCLICAITALLLTNFVIIEEFNSYFSVFTMLNDPFRLTWIVVLFLFGYPLLIAAAVAGLYFVRERSTTIISQLSPVAKKAGRKGK